MFCDSRSQGQKLRKCKYGTEGGGRPQNEHDQGVTRATGLASQGQCQWKVSRWHSLQNVQYVNASIIIILNTVNNNIIVNNNDDTKNY